MNLSRSSSFDIAESVSIKDASSCGAALLLLQVSKIACDEVHSISPTPKQRQIFSFARRPRLLPEIAPVRSSNSLPPTDEAKNADVNMDDADDALTEANASAEDTPVAPRCRTVSLCSIDLPDHPSSPAVRARQVLSLRAIAPPPTLLSNDSSGPGTVPAMASPMRTAGTRHGFHLTPVVSPSTNLRDITAPGESVSLLEDRSGIRSNNCFPMTTTITSTPPNLFVESITTPPTPSSLSHLSEAEPVSPSVSPPRVIKKQFVGTSLKGSSHDTAASRCGGVNQSSSSSDPSVRAVLRKKFSWKSFPELEAYLIEHRPRYLQYSSQLNYTAEQKRYNNSLTQGLLDLAAENGYLFEGFTFAAVRDRIRCYYKSYVQAVKKKKRKKRR